MLECWRIIVHGTRDTPISPRTAPDPKQSNVSKHPFFSLFSSTSTLVSNWSTFIYILLIVIILI